MKKEKLDIKKLHYPLWFTISFYVLTILTPIVLMLIEGFNSPNKTFRVTFSVMCFALLIWIFVKTFILANIKTRLENQKESLEHDYRIDIGDAKKTKWLWYTNELWLTIINVITVVLLGGLIIVLALGIQGAAVKVKGIASIIGILYVVAYMAKFGLILKLRGDEDEPSEEVKNEQTERTESK